MNHLNHHLSESSEASPSPIWIIWIILIIIYMNHLNHHHHQSESSPSPIWIFWIIMVINHIYNHHQYESSSSAIWIIIIIIVVTFCAGPQTYWGHSGWPLGLKIQLVLANRSQTAGDQLVLINSVGPHKPLVLTRSSQAACQLVTTCASLASGQYYQASFSLRGFLCVLHTLACSSRGSNSQNRSSLELVIFDYVVIFTLPWNMLSLCVWISS